VARLALCQLVRPTSSPALQVHPARWGLQLSHWQLATRRCPLGGFHLEEIEVWFTSWWYLESDWKLL
jgi:hypothetical protein